MNNNGFGNWSVSFGGDDLSFGQPAVVPAADALLAARGSAIPVHPQQWLWFAADARQGVPVSPDEAFVLGQCGQFARRDDHIARLAQQIRATPQQLHPIFERLLERQLLRPLRQFVPGPSALAPPAPTPSLVIRTCKRPETLNTLLHSLDPETRAHLSGPIYVVDDSADAGAEAQTRALVQSARARLGLKLRVFGSHEREAWRQRLLGHVALNATEQATFDELLSPERAPAPVPGRAFNWAVLLGAGQTLSILDDDFQFPLKRFASAQASLEVRNSFAYLAQFPDPGDTESLQPISGNPYAEARRLLGQSAGALIANLNWDAETSAGQNASDFEWLRSERRVRAVIQGTYGSFGVATSLNLCGPGQRTLAHLLRPPFRLERLQADPIYYGLERTRLAPAAVSLPWLIDAQSLVPPTNACGVAEDTLFASLLTQLDPHACFAYVPSLIGHKQSDHRDRLQASKQAIGFGANHFVAQMLQIEAGALGASAADRLYSLSRVLDAWLALPDAELDRRACRWWNEERANAAALLSDSLQQNPQAPAPWIQFVQEMRQANLRQEPELGNNHLTALRRSLGQTALACRIWPNLFATFAERDPDGREVA